MNETHTEDLLDRLAEVLCEGPAPMVTLMVAAKEARRRHVLRRRFAAAVTAIMVGGAGFGVVVALAPGTDRVDSGQQVATDGGPVIGSESEGSANEGPPGWVLERDKFGGMRVEDRTYEPGETMRLFWPRERRRGLGYTLDMWRAGGWEPAYGLRATTSRGQSTIPSDWWPVGDVGAVFDVGLRGPGPDLATVPDTASPGTYRLCTSNSRRPACTILEVG